MSKFYIDGQLHAEVAVSDDEDEEGMHQRLLNAEVAQKLKDLQVSNCHYVVSNEVSKDSAIPNKYSETYILPGTNSWYGGVTSAGGGANANANYVNANNAIANANANAKEQAQAQRIYWETQKQKHPNSQKASSSQLSAHAFASLGTTAGTSPSISSTAPVRHVHNHGTSPSGCSRSYGQTSTWSASAGSDDGYDCGADDEDEDYDYTSVSTSNRASPSSVHAYATASNAYGYPHIKNPLSWPVGKWASEVHGNPNGSAYAPKAMQVQQLQQPSRQHSSVSMQEVADRSSSRFGSYNRKSRKESRRKDANVHFSASSNAIANASNANASGNASTSSISSYSNNIKFEPQMKQNVFVGELEAVDPICRSAAAKTKPRDGSEYAVGELDADLQQLAKTKPRENRESDQWEGE